MRRDDDVGVVFTTMRISCSFQPEDIHKTLFSLVASHNHPPQHPLNSPQHYHTYEFFSCHYIFLFFPRRNGTLDPTSTSPTPQPNDHPPPEAIPNPNLVYQDVSFQSFSGASASSRHCCPRSLCCLRLPPCGAGREEDARTKKWRALSSSLGSRCVWF